MYVYVYIYILYIRMYSIYMIICVYHIFLCVYIIIINIIRSISSKNDCRWFDAGDGSMLVMGACGCGSGMPEVLEVGGT